MSNRRESLEEWLSKIFMVLGLDLLFTENLIGKTLLIFGKH